MKQLDQQQFVQLCQQGKPLAVGRKGPRLLNLTNGQIIKIFWPRKCLTSDQLYPYAKRFVRNATCLKKAGILAPVVTDIQRVRASRIYLVTYDKILGQDVRDIIEHNDVNVLSKVAEFIAKLHNGGVFFRGIHLGNVLQCGQQGFALIDIVKVKFYKRAMPFFTRYRNLKHLLTNRNDVNYFKQFGIARFLQIYYQHTQLPKWQETLLSSVL